jgi:hypothetical protein
MQLARHHWFALAGAAAISGLALSEAVVQGATGEGWIGAAPPAVANTAMAVHAVGYATLFALLHIERARIGVNRSARVFGWLLRAAFAMLALVVAIPLSSLPDTAATIIGVPLNVGFLLQFLCGAGLGLSLIRRPDLGVGAKILLAMVPVFVASLALGAVADSWQHAAYMEATVAIGVALLGTATPSKVPPNFTPDVAIPAKV